MRQAEGVASKRGTLWCSPMRIPLFHRPKPGGRMPPADSTGRNVEDSALDLTRNASTSSLASSHYTDGCIDDAIAAIDIDTLCDPSTSGTSTDMAASHSGTGILETGSVDRIAVDLSRNSSTSSLSSHYSDQLGVSFDSIIASIDTEDHGMDTQTNSTYIYGSHPGPGILDDIGSTSATTSQTGSTSTSGSTTSTPSLKRKMDDTLDSVEDGNSEDPVFIGYSPTWDGYLSQIPWGVQWEIVRYGTTQGKYSHFEISDLSGSLREKHTMAGPKLMEIIRNLTNSHNSDPVLIEKFRAAFQKENATKSPWEELDREEAAIAEHKEHLKSCRDRNCDRHTLYLHNKEDGWHGGKVHFTARLKCLGDKNSKTKPIVRIDLEKPCLSSSTRFSRRFGSSAFVRIRLDRNDRFQHGNFLKEYFRRPFVISGRVFRAFYSKERLVFLVRTHEEVIFNKWNPNLAHVGVQRKVSQWTQDVPFLEFLKWHNDLSRNRKQSVTKWAARFSLGLSNSVPGVLIARGKMHRIKDTISPEWKGDYNKAPTEMVMTDGCGFANADFFRQLQEIFSWDSYPTTVQMRLNGAKGLLILHPDHQSVTEDPCPEVWLRDSQMKIQYRDDSLYDRALYTVDVLRSSHLHSPARLAVETIINFAENGVRKDVFISLMKTDLKDRIDRLTTFEDSDSRSLLQLWSAVARKGGVFTARLAREANGKARSLGYIFEDRAIDSNEVGEDEESDELAQTTVDQSSPWWWDPVSGSPSSLEETVMHLLDSGFSPQTCNVLRAKLREVARSVLNAYVTKHRLAVPMSCSAWVVPDPTGVLAPGEVHIKSSYRNLIDQEGNETDIVVGDVLLTRHPCKVPTDVQKATAVAKYELRNYVDVIVVSTKGHIVNGELLGRHLASMTGGGDYDGDLMEAFWQPDLVAQFKSADKRYADEPKGLSDCLESNNEAVVAFRKRVPSYMPDKKQIYTIQDFLLSSLDSAYLVGLYSNYWEYSIYCNGYFHDETVRLAYVFCKVLDGSKTGTTVKAKQRDQDKKAFNSTRPPPYKEKAGLKGWHERNMRKLERGSGLRAFIMDDLKAEIELEQQAQMRIVDDRLGDLPPSALPPDEDLLKPWREFVRQPGNEDAKRSIMDHVSEVRQSWTRRRQSNFTSLPITVRQDILRGLSQQFAAGPTNLKILMTDEDHSIKHIKASYAYTLDIEMCNSRWSRFPWDVVFGALCEIKAKAQGPTKMVTADFYSAMTIHRAFTR